MAADERRQRLVLGVLVAALGLIAWWQFGPSDGGVGGPTTPAGPTARPGPGQAAVSPAETLSAGVGLARLAQVPATPTAAGRDPFVLGGSTSSEVAAGGGGSRAGGRGGLPPAATPPVVPLPPPGPAPPPPIAVKFIGIVERVDVGRLAVLSDGRNVYYGREGEIVDGRWRIVRIGEESLQIEYVDGRGRQTVRLTG
jgi:hypothetical protein